MKKLLFVGIRYHGYTKAMIDEFERQGYAVTFYDIEPWSTSRKVLHSLLPAIYLRSRNSRHRTILARECSQLYDLVFFLQAHQFSPENLQQLRLAQPRARFVLYNWDSVGSLVNRGGDYRPLLPYFDRAYTFDRADAAELKIGYLPLFCVREFQGRIADEKAANCVYFVGNLENVRRYRAVHAFWHYCRQHDIPFSVYLACRPRMYLRLLAAGILPRGVRFGSVSQQEFLQMLDGAASVFDFANHDQAGFTMRVMENLCAGKKIITNNKSIKKEAFYTSERIFVFESLDFSEVDNFIKRPVASPDASLADYYIQNFVHKLLD